MAMKIGLLASNPRTPSRGYVVGAALRRVCAIMVAACSMAMVGMTSRAEAAAPSTSREAVGVAQICKSVMRVSPGEAHYDGCVESLSQSMQSLSDSRRLEAVREGCLSRGAQPATSDLAVCIVQSSAAAAGPSAYRPIESAVTIPRDADIPEAGKSYFYASSRARFHREQLSCAAIGFDPSKGGFGSCVASLAATLFALDNPQN